jgi:hypothetical protein
MTDAHKSQVEQKANRIVEWLVENRTTFEEQGVSQDALTSAVGMTEGDVTEAIDHLENREEVVRIPQGMTIPAHFLLKPGRGWPEIKDKIAGKSSNA